MTPPIVPTPPTPPPPAATHEAASERHALDRSLIHGIAWTAALKWFTQILSWGSTIVVARILSPHDYGLVGMATVYVGLVQLVNEAGLSAAIVQRRGLSNDQISRLGGMSILLGVGFCAVSIILSGAIAGFFGEPAVRWLVIALSSIFVTTAFQVLPRALLQRELQYRRLALLEGTEAVAITVGTLAFALSGFSYWALALGNIGGRLVSTVLALLWRAHPLAWPRRLRSLQGEIAFGSHIVVSRVAWYAYNNADTAIVGRVLGSVALGAYNIGWTIASIPVDRMSALVSRVTPGVFAAIQTDAPALRRYVLGLTEGMALIAFPVSIGMALVAPAFVHVVLGAKWDAAVMPLRLLALYGGFRSLTTLLPQVLVATGHSRRSMEFNLLAVLVLPVAFLIGSRWGTTGVALGWIIGYPLVVIPFFYRTAFRILDLPTVDYLRALWPAASGALAMMATVLAVQVRVTQLSEGALLATEILVGAATYAAVLWFGHRARVETFLKLYQRFR